MYPCLRPWIRTRVSTRKRRRGGINRTWTNDQVSLSLLESRVTERFAAGILRILPTFPTLERGCTAFRAIALPSSFRYDQASTSTTITAAIPTALFQFLSRRPRWNGRSSFDLFCSPLLKYLSHLFLSLSPPYFPHPTDIGSPRVAKPFEMCCSR